MRHGSFSKKFIVGKNVLQMEDIDSVDVFNMILTINIIQLSSVLIILSLFIFSIFLFVKVSLICLRNSILYLNNLTMENCIRIRDIFVKYKYHLNIYMRK